MHLAHDLASVGFHRNLTACERQAAGELPVGPLAANPPAIVPRPAAQSSAGEIRDVAAGIHYLERATFVTGETLHIDGGEAADHRGPPPDLDQRRT